MAAQVSSVGDVNTEKEDDDPPKQNWREDIKIPGQFNNHHEEFLTIITEFEYMWDGHLVYIKTLKHCIQLTDLNVTPIRCRPYRAGPRALAVAKAESTGCSSWISLSLPERYVPHLCHKKDGPFCIFIDNSSLNAVTVTDSYLIPRMENGIDSYGDAQVFSHLDTNWRVQENRNR